LRAHISGADALIITFFPGGLGACNKRDGSNLSGNIPPRRIKKVVEV